MMNIKKMIRKLLLFINEKIPLLDRIIRKVRIVDNALFRDRKKLTGRSIGIMRNVQLKFKYKPLISIIMPVYNTPVHLLEQAINSVLEQIYPRWELCMNDDGSKSNATVALLRGYAKRRKNIKLNLSPRNEGISEASNKCLKMVSGDYILLLDSDDVLGKDALFQLVNFLQHHRDAEIIYSDNDRIDENNIHFKPFYKPDWSPELMLSYCYVGCFKAFKKSLIDKIGGFQRKFNNVQDYGLFLRASEHTKNIYHIPLILYSWRVTKGQLSALKVGIEQGIRSLAEHLARRKINWVNVSQADFAKPIMNGVFSLSPRSKLKDKVSIIIRSRSDRRSLEKCIKAIRSLTTYGHYEIIIAGDPGTINSAVKKCRSEFIVLVNDNIEIMSPDWIEQMLIYAKIPEVGVVGGRPNPPVKSRGYDHLALVAGNCNAVDKACMMVKKSVFKKAGYRVVYNPAVKYYNKNELGVS